MLSLQGLHGLLVLQELLVLQGVLWRGRGRGCSSLALLSVVHEVGDDVYGHGEDDGAVVLCRDTVQSLEISQLEQEINK